MIKILWNNYVWNIKEVFEKEKAKKEESKEDQSLKRKFDNITTIKGQIHEMKMIKQIKLDSKIEEEQDELSQELIRLEIKRIEK